MDDLNRSKKCVECNEWKPITQFTTNGYDKNSKKAFRNLCRKCNNAIYRKIQSKDEYYDSLPKRRRWVQEQERACMKLDHRESPWDTKRPPVTEDEAMAICRMSRPYHRAMMRG